MVNYHNQNRDDHAHIHYLLEKQRELMRPILSFHGGKEIRVPRAEEEGAGLKGWLAGPSAKAQGEKSSSSEYLVVFENALDATTCAIEIQKALHEYNRRAPISKDILLRIGIHWGEVERRGGEVFGEGVAVASKIAVLGEGGEICISAQVYAQVRNKVPYPMERLPNQTLKNVQYPVDVYRLMTPIEGSRSGQAGPKNRIAVLPLSNISPDPSDQYFADGLTEELITVLSQVQGLRVIARTSVDHYKGKDKTIAQIGRELDVGSVMEGSVRMAGDRLRVTVQLIDASNEEHVWSENYDRRLEDIFAVQSDIARKVSDSLKVKLLAKEERKLDLRGAGNISAYTTYVKGRTLLAKRKREELLQAKELFESAISQDPTYAPAYAGLADAYYLLGDYWAMPMDVAREKAKEMLSKALELDPELAEAHASMGRDLGNEYRHVDAEAEFKRALESNPSYPMAHMWYAMNLSAMGRTEESLEQYRLAEELDPLSVLALANISLNLALTGRTEEGLRKLEKAVNLDPGSLFMVDMSAFFYYLTGDAPTGLKVLEAYRQYHQEATVIVDFATLYAALGDKGRASQWLEKFLAFPESTFGRAWFTAVVYGELGDLDNFFLWANRAVDKNEMRFWAYRLFPAYSKPRGDPRWGELLARANLKP
jgi:adenylate cyclase